MKNKNRNINGMIIESVQTNDIRNHSELLDILNRDFNIRVNQSTLSRKLSSLNIRKVAGYYAIERSNITTKQEISFLQSRPNMIIAKTPPGHASAVAHQIDQMIPEDEILSKTIQGTIAGDDTIFIATDGSTELFVITYELKKRFS